MIKSNSWEAFLLWQNRRNPYSGTNTKGKPNIIHQLLEEYDIQTTEDIQDNLKDLLGDTIKEMMETEMDDQFGI